MPAALPSLVPNKQHTRQQKTKRTTTTKKDNDLHVHVETVTICRKRKRQDKQEELSPTMPKKKPSSSDDAGACANCERTEPTMSSCARCGLVKYCGRDCQRAHWKEHKTLCTPKVDRVPKPLMGAPTSEPQSTAKTIKDEKECAICLDSLSQEDGSVQALPCGHFFHGSCVEGLRARGVAKVCPLCRADLPPGADQMFEDATRRYFVVEARPRRGQSSSWGAPSAADQREMKEVVQL